MRRTLLVVLSTAVMLAGSGSRFIAIVAVAQSPLRNGLAESPSPYLRAAARQPVHWQEWNDEVFALARKLDRPVYLDIGAIWCHWCHEMDRESYENSEIAALINELFVPVKVDRDVRPDIDARYQRAVVELAGSGGWPLTVILTPDGNAFYGATYLPPETLRTVLRQVAQGYRTDRQRVAFTAESIRKRVAASDAKVATLNGDVITGVVDHLRRNFDSADGGFSQAPKFPPGNALALLVHRYIQTGDVRLLEMVTRTLDKMAAGGVRDQLSGRFHRYTTDRSWRLPHFEVMLYTQAEVLSTYLDAYALTGNETYRQVAEELIGFLKASFSGADGGFYASHDADASADDDGSYYTWSVQSTRGSASAGRSRHSPSLLRHWSEGRNGDRSEDEGSHPECSVGVGESRTNRTRPAETCRRGQGADRVWSSQDDRSQARPTCARNRPQYPDGLERHDGVVVPEGVQTLGDEEARAFALKTLDFILKRNFSATAGMFHSFLGSERLVPGLLADQVMIAQALLDAYEVTGDPNHLIRARQIMIWTIQNLWDASGGAFFDTKPNPNAAGLLAIPHKPIHDTPATSGNAVAAQVLNRLYYFTQESRFRDFAKVTIETFAGRVRDEGTFMAALGVAAQEYVEYPTTAIVIGKAGDPTAAPLHRAALSAFRPGKIVMRVEPDRVNRDQLPAAVRPVLDSVGADRWPLAFVCSATACALPTASPTDVAALVRNFGLTRR